jgi:glutathionylspermidine synthase
VQRLSLDPRPDWPQKADAIGFTYHHTDGGAYWDESAAYQFTLEEIEADLEAPAGELHGMCLDLVAQAVRDERLLTQLAIPQAHWDLIAASWRKGEASLYGRFDLGYGGEGPAKLYEYNADTPTSVFEAATFQWLWLEDLIERGELDAEADQFNRLFEALRDRLAFLCGRGERLHFTCVPDAVEDRQTVRFLEELATQAGLRPKFTPIGEIGVTKAGVFVDHEDETILRAFKLYPWEDMLREAYAVHLKRGSVRWLEPPWKAILSNKGILPLLWARHRGHPNLLEAYFENDPAVARMGATYVRKPLFSREGANVEVVGGPREPVLDQGYGDEGHVIQAFHPPPDFDGRGP